MNWVVIVDFNLIQKQSRDKKYRSINKALYELFAIFRNRNLATSSSPYIRFFMSFFPIELQGQLTEEVPIPVNLSFSISLGFNRFWAPQYKIWVYIMLDFTIDRGFGCAKWNESFNHFWAPKYKIWVYLMHDFTIDRGFGCAKWKFQSLLGTKI